MYKKNRNKYGQIIIASVCVTLANMGYPAQEAQHGAVQNAQDPQIAQKVAQRKAAEQEIAGSVIFKNLIDYLNKKHDQEADQKVHSDIAKLEALRVQLQTAGTPEDQVVAALKALNNEHRQADKLFLAAQKQEKQSQIHTLVAQKWPAYAHYALDFKNY